ncbi:hypothetical protein [Cellulomonas endophytica]|uniref:glycoside hydrolase family 38 N-terminal domain-containing protein n=1 Tax=Cellulomonas endophytica TaxID=2494735 RepID=UPI0010119F04|nr:hypothetical protein [Cellulomonas endophytica]
MRLRQVLLLGHTHHDVGYTHSPRVVDRAHADAVGRVLDLVERDRRDGPDAFRWTFEVSRPVLRHLALRGPEGAARLADAARRGRVSVTGGYLNSTTLPSAAELDEAYARVATLRSAGLPVRTVQHGDVNGLPWGTVEAMRRAGLGRLLLALNPDHGRPPLPQPSGFWWEGVSGERVLVWLSTHYGVGEEWGLVDGDVVAAEARVAAFVARLEAREDLPVDTAVVHAGNDNRWPTDRFTAVVRHWNARHPGLPMRTATVDEVLDVLEPQLRAAGDAVPVLRGEWSDWWAHGHGSTAPELATYREARAFRGAAGAALGLARLRGGGDPVAAEVVGYRRGPYRLRAAAEVEGDLTRVGELFGLVAEHTWGSWESFSRPRSGLSRSAWNAKAGYAYEAWDLARDLAVEGMVRLLASADPADPVDPVAPEAPVEHPAGAPVLVVVNPAERERTAPVEAEVDGRRRVRAVVTVPAFGVAVLPVPRDPGPPVRRRTLEHGAWRVVVDPAAGGVVSLRHRPSGRELVDQRSPVGLGAVVVETVDPAGRHPYPADPKRFRPEDPGPAFVRRAASGSEEPRVAVGDGWAEVRWTQSVPGLPDAQGRLVVHEGTDLVDVEVDLVKPAVLGPESVHVAFPFAVARPTFLVETAGAVFAADAEQLPDTCRDWYSVQHAVGVLDDDDDEGGGGVLWGTADVPLVQLGRLRTGEWARALDATPGHLFSWVANNLHFTNFQASQDATGRYRWRLAPVVAGLDRAAVAAFGRDLGLPLQARGVADPRVLVGPGPLLVGASGLRVDPPDAVLAELAPTGDDGVRLRLRNPAGVPADAVVTWHGPGAVDGTGPVHLGPHGVADLHLRRADGRRSAP